MLADRALLGPEDLDLSPDDLPAILPLAEAKEKFQRDYINEMLTSTTATAPRPPAISASIPAPSSATWRRAKGASADEAPDLSGSEGV